MIEQKQPPTWLQKNVWYIVIGLSGLAFIWWDIEPILFAKLSEKIHIPFDLDKPIDKHFR